ncbi:MAG: ATP-binding cassette domain-containing protein [Proteobacteria bacterium]|nr:ATP-binding cassette domain-containing protein [Pseudomonadota bacterium]
MRSNRTTVVLGPGGSGKSTLLRLIGGLIVPPSEGLGDSRASAGDFARYPVPETMWHSGDIKCINGDIRILPQALEVSEHTLTALLQSQSGQGLKSWLHEFWQSVSGSASELLESVVDTPLLALPGPLRRLAGFTVAASVPGSLLLIDEPESGAGERECEWMRAKLAAIRGQHTIVLVTRNLKLARATSDDAIFLLDGRIVEAGETSVLFTHPAHQRTRDLLTFGS